MASARNLVRNLLAGNSVGNIRNVLAAPSAQSAFLISSRQLNLSRWETDEKNPADRFRALPGAEDNVFLTYVWVDGTGQNVRAKTKVVEKEPKSASGNALKGV